MTANPVDLVYVDGVAVSKSDVRGYEKLRVRKWVADPNEVNNTDFSGQYAGLYVRSLQAFFDLETGDTTTPGDDVNVIIDYAGNRFFRVDTGGAVYSDREITVPGDVIVLVTDNLIRMNKTISEATNVELVASADFVKPDLTVKDQKGDATNYPISLVPNGSETIDGQTGPRVIDWPYGGLRLRPVTGGWLTLP